MARKAGRKKGLAAFSDEQLQQELARRMERRVRELKQERMRLDAEIRKIEGGKVRGRKPGAVREMAATAEPKGGKRKRSSQAEVKAMVERVGKAVAEQGKSGISMGELRKNVRGSTIQLRAALKKLISDKQIKKSGDRRQTKYYPA